MEKRIKITINGETTEVEKGTSILEAARLSGVIIPTLCYHKDLCVAGNCRVCVIEIAGQKRLAAACSTPCEDGMEVLTNTLKVRNSRKHIIELLLSEHNAECTSCYRNGNCELQKLASDYKIMTQDFIDLIPFKNYTIDNFSPSIIKDDSKCIRCQRCVRTCSELQSVNALTMSYKGEHARVTTFFEKSMNDVVLPMATSCSPGWIKFIEHLYPDFLNHLSSCKSPQQMFGALVKTYYAKAKKIDPSKIVSVSVMPCTAKKFEAARPEMRDSGYRDVDYVLTTRELAIMIKQAGIDFLKLPDMHFDRLMGESTGAGVIFGATGGVMEAALRTAYELVTGREVPFENLNIAPVRGMEGVKEASIVIENPLKEWSFLEGVQLKCAVAHGLANAKLVMDELKSGQSKYHFIEFMACPGGCLGGGGQPIPTKPEIREKRAKAIYAEDYGMPIRKSHQLLHTKYTKRTSF